MMTGILVFIGTLFGLGIMIVGTELYYGEIPKNEKKRRIVSGSFLTIGPGLFLFCAVMLFCLDPDHVKQSEISISFESLAASYFMYKALAFLF